MFNIIERFEGMVSMNDLVQISGVKTDSQSSRGLLNDNHGVHLFSGSVNLSNDL